MDTPSQDSFNRNNGRGPHQPHRPFHPYKNRRNNNFQQNNHYRNNRFNGPADGPNNFAPQGFSSPIVRNGGGGGEYFHNYRNNRNGGTANYRNDGFRNRKNFTPFKKQQAGEYDVRKYFHVSMIHDPWTGCTKKTEFVFANEPTDDDLVSDLVDEVVPDAGHDSSGLPVAAAATDESSSGDEVE